MSFVRLNLGGRGWAGAVLVHRRRRRRCADWLRVGRRQRYLRRVDDDDPRRVENVVWDVVLVRQPRVRYQWQPLPLGHRCARRSPDSVIHQETTEPGIAFWERRAC